MGVHGYGDGCEVRMSKKAYKDAKPERRQVGADIRRTRAFGDYDKTAREAQRKAATYGRARGNA